MPESDSGKFDLVDAETFDRLYQQWSDPIYRYLAHLVGHGALAEDLFQDAWMKAIEYRHQLRSQESFVPWIFRIARNLALNHRRTYERKAQVWIISNLCRDGDDSASGLMAQQVDDRPTPRDEAIEIQRRQILQEALLALDTETQEMLQLRYFEHLALSEVAEILDRPLGTVCTKVHRGLKAVRARLETMGHESLKAL